MENEADERAVLDESTSETPIGEAGRVVTAPLVLELFCCAGGMAEGLRRAGIEVGLAFDRDPAACASYEANLGRRPIQNDRSAALVTIQPSPMSPM